MREICCFEDLMYPTPDCRSLVLPLDKLLNTLGRASINRRNDYNKRNLFQCSYVHMFICSIVTVDLSFKTEET